MEHGHIDDESSSVMRIIGSTRNEVDWFEKNIVFSRNI
jgi:hypothetical protein